jgi:hypothetical protein
MKKITFHDGYIEENELGELTCIGETAVQSAIIIRKTGVSLSVYKQAFDSVVSEQVNKIYANNL